MTLSLWLLSLLALAHVLLCRQVIEHACTIPSLMMGEVLPSVARDIDTYSYRLPLGVTGGICP